MAESNVSSQLRERGSCEKCGSLLKRGNRCHACRDTKVATRDKRKSENKRAKWKEQGLCSGCGKPPEPGGKMCQACRDYHKAYRTKLRSKGLCKCGRSLVAAGKICELCLANVRDNTRNYRHQCVMAYGGYKCVCCGETTPEFLQLDHINNDGGPHRREVGHGSVLYRWLIKNGFPPGIQILCANCNYAKAHYGRCPHQPDKELNSAPRQYQDDQLDEGEFAGDVLDPDAGDESG